MIGEVTIACRSFREGLLLNCPLLSYNTNLLVSDHGFRCIATYASLAWWNVDVDICWRSVCREVVFVKHNRDDIALQKPPSDHCLCLCEEMRCSSSLDWTHPFVFLLIFSIRFPSKLQRCRFCHNSNKRKNGQAFSLHWWYVPFVLWRAHLSLAGCWKSLQLYRLTFVFIEQTIGK